MPAFVLDASVLAALYVDDPASDDAAAAIERLGDHHQAHAPDLALLEVANALRKRVRRKEAPAARAMSAIADLSRAPILFHPSGPLAETALGLALMHGVTAYDAAYLALAARIGATVVTADEDMRRRGVSAGLPIVRPADAP